MPQRTIKNKKKSAFSSAFSQRSPPKLTKVQSEVLYLLTKEFLTPKQIATRRGTKIRTIQATIKKLKDLGIINNAYQEVRFFAPTNALFKSSMGDLVRLHGEEWNVKILFKDSRYKGILRRVSFDDVDGNTVRLSRDSLEVYSGRSFYGDDPSVVTRKSLGYWDRFFRVLEGKYGVILVKPLVNNRRRVNAHYGFVDNDLAKDVEERGERIRVYSREDGKLWFLIDNSFNLHEAECVHPVDSKDDADVVKSFFNDLRGGMWHDTVGKVEVMFRVQQEYAEQIKLHLKVQEETLKTLKKIQRCL